MTAMVLLSTWMESQVEFWRKTKYEGYDVSSFGRVRSWWTRGSKGKRRPISHLLSGSKDSYGYWFIELGRGSNGERRRSWVHRLVVEAFVENVKDLPEINHRTALKSDNRLDNLEWISGSGNVRHATRNGLRERARFPGMTNHNATITDADVRKIRERRLKGERPVDIARDYSPGTVAHILAGRSWKHVN